MAIQNFKHKGLEELFLEGRTSKINKILHRNCLMILDLLDSINDVSDCEGVKDFHELHGNRRGTFSIHVNRNFCITFTWYDGDVFNVDFEDYH